METNTLDLSALLSIFESSQLTQDPQDLQKYGRDWTNYFEISPLAVVFPISANQVQQLVLWARKNRVTLVPSGGRTGLSGGAVAANKEIVVSFERMRRIWDYNSVEQTVRVEPGVITEELQNFAKAKGAYYPVDFAARGSAQIGGNIATNAGGIKVLKYGLTRDWISSLTVVTGTGDILELNRGLIKNATGFDLRHLFVGSEGTLGFIVEATMQFTASPPPTKHVLVALPNLDSIVAFFKQLRERDWISAYEMFSDVGLKHVIDQKRLPAPFSQRAPYYVLTEIEVQNEKEEALLLDYMEMAMEKGWLLDGSIAQNEQQIRTFWRYREDITESVSHHSPYKNDISVRISHVAAFVRDLDEVLKMAYPDWEVIWFGHIGDGNLHISILKPSKLSKGQFYQECQHMDEKVFDVVRRHQGSISAEHGVGLTKKRFLSYTKSPSEIEYMKQIKSLFDPDGILNPGKLF